MFKKIMVPLDGSELAECVLPYLKTLTEGKNVETIVFVRVVEPLRLAQISGETAWFSEDEMKQMDNRSKSVAEGYLEQLASGLDYGNIAIQKQVLVGRTAEQLTEYAHKNDVDLIVVATHGRSGVSRWVMGSVADRLLRSVSVPVLMVRAPGCGPKA